MRMKTKWCSSLNCKYLWVLIQCLFSICRLELCLFSFPPSQFSLFSCSKLVGIICARARFLSAAFLLLLILFLFLLPSLLTEKNADSLRDRSFPSFFFSVSGDSLMSRIYSSLSGGELFEKITSEGYSMSEAEVINYMRQICEGVKHMHERNIIHLGNYLPVYKRLGNV